MVQSKGVFLIIFISICYWSSICSEKKVIHNLEIICISTEFSKTLGSTLNREIENINKQLKPNFMIHNSACAKDYLWDNPYIIQKTICKLLQPQLRKKAVYATSAVFLISDNLDSKSSQIIEYFVNIISNLGIPTITWLPSQLGQIPFEEGPMIMRLEPNNKHIAEAMFDFVQTYNWNMAVILISRALPGSLNFIQMLKDVIDERKSPNQPNYFKLKIVDEIYFDGLVEDGDVATVLNSKEKMLPYKKSIEQILSADHRIILFYGKKYDMIIMHKAALTDPKLSKIFGAEFVWIVGPQTIYPSVTIRNKKEKFSLNLETTENLPPLPGVFGFAYAPTSVALTDNLNIAVAFWKKALEKMIKKLSMQTNETSGEISKKLVPKLRCDSESDLRESWNYGKQLYRHLGSITVDHNSEFHKFSEHKYLNNTSFLVMNTGYTLDKTQEKDSFITNWNKVGTWMMSSKFDDKRTKLQIDGVTWPGEVNKPPLGRPSKFKLRVSTLKEEPFVIFSVKQDRTCGNNALSCYVLYESLSISQEEIEKSKNRTKFTFLQSDNYTEACCTGMAIDILRELMKDLNFEVELFEVSCKKSESRSAEKGWNSVLESLVNKKVDMAVSAFKITPNRSEQVDFTVPFQETGIAILVALHEGSISPTAFLKPYDWESWMVILIFSVHCCGTAMFIYEWLSPRGLDRGNVPPREHRFSLFRALWLIWAMLFGAAVNVDSPRGTASRFLGCIWALFGLVFLASYTANLAAFMIAKEDHYDLKGLNDWRFQRPWNYKPEFRFATVLNSASEENIILNYPEIAQYMRRYNKSSVEEGIRALKQKEIDAFIYDSNVLEFRAAKDEGCKLRTVGNLYAVTGYGIAFPKGSKWYLKVNDLIMQYQKYDLLHRWKTFWLSGACKKTDKLANTNRTLGVRNFISAFILLLTGLIMSAILLIMEHLFFRYLRPKMSNLDQYGCCGLISLSMGQLLSFEQTVNQTVDLVKNYKCHNPLCENQIWRLRKELTMSKEIIRKLEMSFENLNSSLRSMSNLTKTDKSETIDRDEADIPLLKSKQPSPTYQCMKNDNSGNKISQSFDTPSLHISNIPKNNRNRSKSFISANSIVSKRPPYTCVSHKLFQPKNENHSTATKPTSLIIQQESSL